MPGADDATINFATKPDRAIDGGFLQENTKATDFLTADKIQRGSWLYKDQLDPGNYYVMIRATDCHAADVRLVRAWSQSRSQDRKYHSAPSLQRFSEAGCNSEPATADGSLPCPSNGNCSRQGGYPRLEDRSH